METRPMEKDKTTWNVIQIDVVDGLLCPQKVKTIVQNAAYGSLAAKTAIAIYKSYSKAYTTVSLNDLTKFLREKFEKTYLTQEYHKGKSDEDQYKDYWMSESVSWIDDVRHFVMFERVK